MGKKKIKEGIRKELINIGKTYHQDDCSFINIDDVVDYIYKTYHKGKDKIGHMDLFEDWSAEFNAEIEEAIYKHNSLMNQHPLCWKRINEEGNGFHSSMLVGEILETKPLLQKKHCAVIEDLLNEKINAMEVTECNKWEFANLTSLLARIQDIKG